ncbi:MAG: hypothetical protein ACE5J4_03395 [Candidatus Aenigmatarchaeota archaeon]
MNVKEEIKKILDKSDRALTRRELERLYIENTGDVKSNFHRYCDGLEGIISKAAGEIKKEYNLDRIPYAMSPHTKLYYKNKMQIRNWINKNRLGKN